MSLSINQGLQATSQLSFGRYYQQQGKGKKYVTNTAIGAGTGLAAGGIAGLAGLGSKPIVNEAQELGYTKLDKAIEKAPDNQKRHLQQVREKVSEARRNARQAITELSGRVKKIPRTDETGNEIRRKGKISPDGKRLYTNILEYVKEIIPTVSIPAHKKSELGKKDILPPETLEFLKERRDKISTEYQKSLENLFKEEKTNKILSGIKTNKTKRMFAIGAVGTTIGAITGAGITLLKTKKDKTPI